VTDRYLQLPTDFSPRIQALASDITTDLTNPYDRAEAITNWLRANIEYVPVVSFPEGTTDRLEYFLFESKQGFCNYYASAEVLMLRSVGIPARLAVGFAQGEPNMQNTFYTVREKDAHAWPEVYFPGYGWIEFEPTGNQEPVNRPLVREEKPADSPDTNNNVPELDALAQEKPVNALELEPQAIEYPTRVQVIELSVAVGICLLVLIGLLLKRRFAPNVQASAILKSVVERNGWEAPIWLARWTLWSSLTPIQKYFHSINISLRWMKAQQPVHITPAERADILRELIPAASESVETLLKEYQSTLFSRQDGNLRSARSAAWNILYKTVYTRLKIFILGYN
jgi:hypothetical protein